MSYQNATITDFNRSIDRVMPGGLKRWKILKTTLLGVLTLTFGGYAINQGAQPTPVALMSLMVVASIAGIELSELEAVKLIKKNESEEGDR